MKFNYTPIFGNQCPTKLKHHFHIALLGMMIVCLVFGFIIKHRQKPHKTTAYSLALPALATLPATTEISTLGKPTTIPSKNLAEQTLHTVKIKKGDTLEKIFKRHGVSTHDLHTILALKPANQHFTALQPGKTLKLIVNPTKTIEAITLDISKANTIKLRRTNTGFNIEQQQLPLEHQFAFAQGKARDCLFSSAKRAGLDPHVVSQLIEIFSWNLHFNVHLKPNSTFRVLFEEKYLDGEKIETGNVLAAELNNDGIIHLAIRYTDPKGHTAYFSPEGYSLQQAYLRKPVNFTKITSQFGPRLHPILHKKHQHRGVDYSAPSGTPVMAVGDAKVMFVGKKGGYGNAIELKHTAKHSTFYAHLSRFAQNLKVGNIVKQGDVIGYVGHTGLASGDHLHFEFRVDGVHHNFLTASLPWKVSITGTNRHHFLAHAKEMMHLMDIHEHKVHMASKN